MCVCVSVGVCVCVCVCVEGGAFVPSVKSKLGCAYWPHARFIRIRVRVGAAGVRTATTKRDKKIT